MMTLGAVILLLAQAALCQAGGHSARQADTEVTCANNVSALTCNLCPKFFEDDVLREDWARCGGDCERIEESGREICHPAAAGVNCGEKRGSRCADCPIYQTEEGGVGQNMNLCQGDCQIKHDSRSAYCSTRDEENTTDTTIPRTIAHSLSLLKEVSVNIVNTAGNFNRPPRVQFIAEVCVQSKCCQTTPMNKRNGIYKFATVFGNLGSCSDFSIGQNDEVRVKAVKTSGDSLLRVRRITTQLYGGRQFIAEDVRTGRWMWSDPVIRLLPWNQFFTARISNNVNIEPTENLPEPDCPTDHTCPLNNIHVHERLRDARKFCYYQQCDLFSADLSTIENGDLGTGGYCVRKNYEYPQYKYCCNLEQYFTDSNNVERQGINFPRCNTMNYTRTY